MAAITVSDLNKFYGAEHVLRGLSFEIHEGEKVGLLGENGAGKTTLFKILTGELDYDSGFASVASGKRAGILEQIPVYPDGHTVRQVLESAFPRLDELQSQLYELEREMAEHPTPAVLARYGALSAAFETAGGYERETSLLKVCNGLGIDAIMREKLFSVLSGGEKTRINLARLILEDTDVLLLDEPTNHLDMSAVEWLEDYISRWKGTMVAISHDRFFLDSVADRIIELSEGQAEFYSGNYTFYVREKEARRLLQMAQYEQAQHKINQLKAAAQRMRVWAESNTNLYRRAFAIEKRIERIQPVDRPKTERKMSARFGEREFRGDEVLSAKGLTKGFGERTLIENVEFLVAGGERIALLGDNGSGKTTLIRLITGEETPDAGWVRMGPAVKAAVLPQIIRFDEPERSLLDTVCLALDCTRESARSRLAAFKFPGEDVFKTVSVLSGGEKSRLMLCILMQRDVSLLILDEPTNHLDIRSREWIEEAVEDFDGTLLFVSHDRYFIRRFANRIWFLKNGHIEDYRGDFEQYRIFRERQAAAPAADTPKKEKKPRIADTKTAERQQSALEREIERTEARLTELSAEMEAAATDFDALTALCEEESRIREQLDSLYVRWEESL